MLPSKPVWTYLAFMRLFSRVNQVVFLQVGQLGEILIAGLTLEGPFSTVHSQMDLKTVSHSFMFNHVGRYVMNYQLLKGIFHPNFKFPLSATHHFVDVGSSHIS